MKQLIASGAIVSLMMLGFAAAGCGDPSYDAPPPAPEQPAQQPGTDPATTGETDPYSSPQQPAPGTP